MIGLFIPRYIKDGREMLKAAQKMLSYKRDLLRPEEVGGILTGMQRLEEAIRARSREEVATAGRELDDLFGRHFPRQADAAMRENCEVFLVAIVIAVGVRSFFLQPFTIPTGSMQPTLNGIRGYQTDTPPPNPIVQVVDFLRYGRSYVNVVSKEDDTLISMRDVTKFRFFNFAEIQCAKQTFLVHAPARTLWETFGLRTGTPLSAGQVIARGYVNTGDHVFVDKVSYNFRNPHRAEVFVFNTAGIQTRENRTNPGAPSQFYIKRLAGLPNDVLRVDPPNLYINGELAKEPAFQRVMSGTPENPKNGYQGYSNPPDGVGGFQFLTSPDATFHVPPKCYFAMGDNSYNSSDSRDWGVVPEQNVMGRGMFVYWPFTSHWGPIK
ncbi:MAG: signal peptidase I [Verrucomicrobiota bacterium]